MKNKILHFFLAFSFLFSLSPVSFTQSCGSSLSFTEELEMTERADIYEDFSLRSSAIRSHAVKIVPIKFHIFGYDSGQFDTDVNDVNAAFEVLQGHYEGIFTFEIDTIIFEANTDLYKETDPKKYTDRYTALNDTNVLNVYSAKPRGYRFCGFATFPTTAVDERLIFMYEPCLKNASTLSHEVGHYFALKHTHHCGVLGCETPYDDSGCGDGWGDDLCDTPPDFNLSGYINKDGTKRKEFPPLWKPDIYNLMSYSNKELRGSLTPQQTDRIIASYHLDHTFSVQNSTPINVVSNLPDLTFSDKVTVDKKTCNVGDTLHLKSVVVNFGSASSPASYLSYYISTDEKYSEDDKSLGVDKVVSLEPDRGDSERQDIVIPSDYKGVNYILFVADSRQQIDEENEDNNVYAFEINIKNKAPTNESVCKCLKWEVH